MFDQIASVIFVLVAIVLFLGSGVWVFVALMLVAAVSLHVLLGFDFDRIGAIMRGVMWRSATSWELSAIPIFLMMGEVMLRSDITKRLFVGLAPWVNRIPGRLLHVNVLGSALFAAVCGSSTATTATIARINLPELTKRGYNQNMAIGSIAGAGGLGIMIPPSLSLIVYGFLAEVSVARLFAAGLVPGLLIVCIFSGYIAISALLRPEIAPAVEEEYSFADRLNGILGLLPVVIMIVCILGAIYGGYATPSESAAVGLAGALAISLVTRQLTLARFFDAVKSTIATTSMILSIVIAASFLSSTLGYLHIPQQIGRGIQAMSLSPLMLMVVITCFYLVLGLFLEGVSILALSLPITLPLVVAAGFDKIWFGIYLVILIEIAMLTPPVGFNLFVMQGMSGWTLGQVARATMPFFLLMILSAFILILVPDIPLWLPNFLFNH